LSSDLEEDVCRYQSANQYGQYSDGGSDCPPDDETPAGLAMSINSESDMDMSDRDEKKSDYSDDGSLYEYPVKYPHPVKSHSSDHGSDSEYQDESPPPVEKPSESTLQISVIERQWSTTETSPPRLVTISMSRSTMTACEMAMLRGSDTLDIKEIQFILERKWNIRIPGYSSDAIRTVRKFNPAQGYQHKMSALLAQKHLAQTLEKDGE
jgi:hypothetical protein